MTLTIENDLSIFNSSISFENSSIKVNGCITLNHTIITVDLSKYYSPKVEKLFLIISSMNCLNIKNTTIRYFNTPSCVILNNENDSSSIFIVFDEDPNCNDNLLIIVIVSIVFSLALIS